ncbi:DUF6731 family protein [Pseudomonas aeruginosa]|uniref:hypothetical protein n=1 Tax=Pseudomonas aeruginosa TaxID=287 RepID=UPI003D2A04C9
MPAAPVTLTGTSLADDEGLVDKNHFVYFQDNELLVMQANRHAGTAVALGKYLTDLNGQHAVSFNPVIQPDATRRLMRDDLTPISIEASFARPTNPDMYPDDDWSPQLLDTLAQIGGGNVKLSISRDKKRVAEGADRLSDRARRAAQAFHADANGAENQNRHGRRKRHRLSYRSHSGSS